MDTELLAPPRFFTRECLELNEFSSRNEWNTDYQQLGCGKFEAWFEFYSSASIRFTSQFCNREMLVSGTPPMGHTALVLPFAAGKPAVFNGSELDVHEGFLIGAETETNLRTPADLQMITVTIPTPRLVSLPGMLVSEPEQGLSSGWRTIKLAPPTSARLRSTINQVFRLAKIEGEQNGLDQVLPKIEQAVIDELIGALGAPQMLETDRRARRNHLRCLRRARDYIEESLHSPIQMPAVAAASGASVRILEMAFREILGVTPVQYVRNRRLIGVHQGLLHPEDGTSTVSGLARDYGFNHMGRFARDYRTLFNEKPSVSLEHGRRERMSR